MTVNFRSLSDVAELLGILATVATTSFGLGLTIGKSRTMRALNNTHERNRFENVYAPIRALLIDCHISSATFTEAPYLRQRLGNAWKQIEKRKFRKAILAIFDKQRSAPSAGVDYGHFPKAKILTIIEKNPQYCDARLMRLATRAERSIYERAMGSGNEELFTSEEFELINHIYDEYDALANKFMGR
jgi:hypothetical protein